MPCLNKLFILSPPATSFPVIPTPNPQPNYSYFQLKFRTQKYFCITTKAYQQEIESESEIVLKKTYYIPPNVKTITSTSNPFVKHCVKLRQSSSYRHSHGSVLVVGFTPIREIYIYHKTLSERPIIDCLLVLENYEIPEEIAGHDVSVVRISSAVIRKISGIQSIDSVEVIALVRLPSTFRVIGHEKDCRSWFSFPHRILVLDGIQDPGNLGTLIRSATAFRWGGVFLLPGCCDPFNDKALRASRGACFQIPIVSGNWEDVESLREEFDMKMLAGHPASEELNGVLKLDKEFIDLIVNIPMCLVLGSEGNGLSEFSKKICELVCIPMAGEFESLNVSVAGGIFMYMLQSDN